MSSGCVLEDDGKAKDEKEEGEEKKKGSGNHQGIAVLGIALIAMGEEIGVEMALRSYSHLVRQHVFCVHSSALCAVIFVHDITMVCP